MWRNAGRKMSRLLSRLPRSGRKCMLQHEDIVSYLGVTVRGQWLRCAKLHQEGWDGMGWRGLPCIELVKALAFCYSLFILMTISPGLDEVLNFHLSRILLVCHSICSHLSQEPSQNCIGELEGALPSSHCLAILCDSRCETVSLSDILKLSLMAFSGTCKEMLASVFIDGHGSSYDIDPLVCYGRLIVWPLNTGSEIQENSELPPLTLVLESEVMRISCFPWPKPSLCKQLSSLRFALFLASVKLSCCILKHLFLKLYAGLPLMFLRRRALPSRVPIHRLVLSPKIRPCGSRCFQERKSLSTNLVLLATQSLDRCNLLPPRHSLHPAELFKTVTTQVSQQADLFTSLNLIVSPEDTGSGPSAFVDSKKKKKKKNKKKNKKKTME